jgi:hypothetical protein
MGSKITAPLILNLEIGRRQVVSFIFEVICTGARLADTLWEKGVWAAGLV